MKHFLEYVKHSYDLIIEIESKTKVILDHEVEAFIVHTFAKYMENPYIPTEKIAIKMLSTTGETGEIRKQHFQEIAEECLLIDGLKLNHTKWPTNKYFKDMGILALEYRAYSNNPPDKTYEKLAYSFNDMSYILNHLRD